jgi:DNA helicase HerA-like ATPase
VSCRADDETLKTAAAHASGQELQRHQDPTMTQPLLIAKAEDTELHLLPRMANRHGLVAGATGTGKTVTLQTLAEQFSRAGVPVFMADVKGDLSGMGFAGGSNAKVEARVEQLKLDDFAYAPSPVTFWDVFGSKGHPVRTTIAELGPLLLDLKDLRAMLQHASEHAADYIGTYGNISAASVGAVQRALLQLEHEGADRLFGEPALDLDDFMQTAADGRGIINILAADTLYNSPRVYATLLLWLLSELFEQLPESGDLDKPRLVFFFDEAHLLFNDAPDALLDKIEQVVRLIRSKGVGVYFVSQNPLDIPDVVLGQLGNRVQHALRAFTPRDQKAVRAAAETFRANPGLDVASAITELGVGEALVSFLDEQGRPMPVERALVCPPRSRIGPASEVERNEAMRSSLLYGHYEKTLDRESAYEILKTRAQQSAEQVSEEQQGFDWGDLFGGSSKGDRKKPGRPRDSVLETVAKSAARTIGSELGRQVLRGVLGSILGGKRRR